MNKAGFLFLGAVISAGSVLFAGCGGDNSTAGTGGAGGGGTDASSSSASGTPASSSASGTPASSSASGGGTAATCDAYCTSIAANCKEATTKQYNTPESCKAACGSFPLGKPGEMSGNSLECRNYHAGAAAMNAALHCEHAGPTGGDHDPTDTMAGACGDGGEAFCTLAVKTCPGVYKDDAACKAAVAKFAADTGTYSTADTTTNNFGCRFYHLSVAAQSTADATTHCPHIAETSPVCNK